MRRNGPSLSQRLDARETSAECRKLEKEVLHSDGRQKFDSACAKLETARRRHLRLMQMIDDPYVRELYRMHYIEGRTWLSIAFATGAYDESVPHKCVSRYMNANGIHISLRLNMARAETATGTKRR